MSAVTPNDVILGIDLGTTNSLIAVCENGRPRVLRDKNGAALVPSVVYWEDTASHPLVGLEARRFRITDSPHTAYSVKRFIGKGKKDLEDPSHATVVDTSRSTDQNIVIRLGKRTFSAIELSAEILKKLKHVAEESLGYQVHRAVVTVPAYFNDSQRSATKAAGALAGLEVVRIVNEPTAAALAYGLDRKRNGLIAVYDLGGGTFDMSVLKLHDGIFEVLATNGDTVLGGDDFDWAAARLIMKQLSGQNLDFENVELKALLIETAEKLKIALSKQESAKADIVWRGKTIPVSLTREAFDQAIEPLVRKTLEITQRALADAGLEKSRIDDVVMVGGSTRVESVRRAVREFFGKEINTSVNPDEVVALGAAIQADILTGRNENMVLLDVVPLSLGIETYGGTIGKIIHRNTKIPAMAQETFTTHVDGQKNVLIHVLQGERELAADCRSLAKFNLKGLPAMPAGQPKIQVTFLVDANGMLTVRAKEAATNTEAAVEVKPTYGLTDEQVERMLEQSFEHAEEDMKNRQLIDTRVEAENVLRSAEKILKEANGEAMPGELEDIRGHVEKVKALMGGQDYLAIRDELEALETSAKPLAEKVMNAAIRKSLRNRRVEDVMKKGD